MKSPQTDYPEIIHPKKRALLTAYAACGVLTIACETVAETEKGSTKDPTGNLYRNHYQWLAHDPKYAAAFRRAQELSCLALEEEARLRAITGWLEPVFHQGKVVGSVRKRSDTLLIFLMKGNNKQKFADRQEITDADGHELVIRVKYDDEPKDPDA